MLKKIFVLLFLTSFSLNVVSMELAEGKNDEQKKQQLLKIQLFNALQQDRYGEAMRLVAKRSAPLFLEITVDGKQHRINMLNVAIQARSHKNNDLLFKALLENLSPSDPLLDQPDDSTKCPSDLISRDELYSYMKKNAGNKYLKQDPELSGQYQ